MKQLLSLFFSIWLVTSDFNQTSSLSKWKKKVKLVNVCHSLKSSYGNLAFSIREFTGSYNLESYSLPEGLQCDIPAQSLKQLTQFLVRLRFPWEHMPILNSLILSNVFPAPRLWHHHRPVCLTQVIPDTFLSLLCDFFSSPFLFPTLLLWSSPVPSSSPGLWGMTNTLTSMCSL